MAFASAREVEVIPPDPLRRLDVMTRTFVHSVPGCIHRQIRILLGVDSPYSSWGPVRLICQGTVRDYSGSSGLPAPNPIILPPTWLHGLTTPNALNLPCNKRDLWKTTQQASSPQRKAVHPACRIQRRAAEHAGRIQPAEC